jgi:hypothetical protein
MPTNVLERIYKLLAKINMGILDGRFNPEKFAELLLYFLKKNGEEKGYSVSTENDLYWCIYYLQSKINTGIFDGRFNSEKFANLLQKFLEHKWNGGGNSMTQWQAIDILGSGKVITAKQSAKAMGMKTPQNACIRYNKKTISQCAEENRKGQDWRLIYCFGLSLRALREKFGTDNVKQPCYDKDCTWWLKSREDVWATKNPLAGYYLINVLGLLDEMHWEDQEQRIAAIGNVERCNEAIFAEAILIIFKVSGERVAETWFHWAGSASPSKHVGVGYFHSDGLHVINPWNHYYIRDVRVSLVRMFDH